jgi:hypothetical protein
VGGRVELPRLEPQREPGGQRRPGQALGEPSTASPAAWAAAGAAARTLGHEEHLGDVVAGYGTDVDLDVLRSQL